MSQNNSQTQVSVRPQILEKEDLEQLQQVVHDPKRLDAFIDAYLVKAYPQYSTEARAQLKAQLLDCQEQQSHIRSVQGRYENAEKQLTSAMEKQEDLLASPEYAEVMTGKIPELALAYSKLYLEVIAVSLDDIYKAREALDDLKHSECTEEQLEEIKANYANLEVLEREHLESKEKMNIVHETLKSAINSAIFLA